MSRKTETKEIDGKIFTVSQLGGRGSQRLLIKILGMLSGSLGMALKGFDGKNLGKKLADMEIDLGKIGDAIPALFEKLTPDEFEAIQKELLEGGGCRVAASPTSPSEEFWPAMDIHLAGSPFTGFKLTLWAFEVNYGNFSAALAAKVTAATKKASLSAVPSIGPSGVS